ncbi:Spo0E family sporulation regulatory protein-aspartic acid phosphatase [Neobacillus niacini]|uniref:Spo0E family sporulation regulatory protein-aspartic acid phosphatase n=1 Tax=Neobacillus niacini TaxID=86668 RepID=UPI0039836610
MNYLLVMIEETQLKLQELTQQFGTTAEETIECQKQLDTLINLLEQALQNNTAAKGNESSLL